MVTDVNNVPLPGVNVFEKGTSNGTISDLDGNYTIKVNGTGSILIFSYVGYADAEIPVGTMTQINVTLNEDLIGLEEVVVVGYGTVKKSDVTGALSSVSEEQIKEMPVQNVQSAMQGRVAGMDVANTSYGLNTTPTIRIRGNRSFYSSNDPLYVVDGITMSGSVNDLNPGDIQSVEVLKDASATAIYGSRGANGVILITTKRGQTGQYSVNFSSSSTLSNHLRFRDVLTGDEFMEIARDNKRSSRRYSTPYPNPADDYQLLRASHYNLWESVKMGYTYDDNGDVVMRDVTDAERAAWGEVMETVPDQVPLYNPEDVRTYDWLSHGLNSNALTQNHQFSVSGGTERISTYFSLGYIDEHGMGVGERYQRISPRLNMEIQATDWLKIGMNSVFNSELTDPGEGLLGNMSGQLPISQPYDSTGTFLVFPTGDSQLKNAMFDDILNTHEYRTYKFVGSYFAEVAFTKSLKYRFNVGQEWRHTRTGIYRNAESSAIQPSTLNDATYNQSQRLHYVIDNLLFYNKEFDAHSIGVTLLQSVEATRNEGSNMYVQDLPFDSQLWYMMGSTSDPTYFNLSSSYNRSQFASFMGRINYSYLGRYLLTASLRYDGTSYFYETNRWDRFPSAALTWKIHEESFMQNINSISQLKLRLGYGTVGQTTGVPYETQGTLASTQYVFGDDPAKGWTPDLLQTRDVGWEKTTTTNIGIDFGLFKNRVSGTIELYRANTHDLLMRRDLPAVTGYDWVRDNVGRTRNQGIEISMNSVNVHTGDFRWETDYIFTMNREEIVELADGPYDDVDNRWFIGHPLTSYYNYVYDGIWQISDSATIDLYNANGNNGFAPGKIRVKDIDENDTIDLRDMTVIGNNVPRFSGGLTNHLYYKGFELSFFIFFRVGHGINSRDGHYFTMDPRYSTPFLVDYYKPMGTEAENADAVHPAPSNTRDKYEEAMWYREVSFLKLRHVTLSYNIPRSLLDKANIKSLQLSVQAFNPLMLTNYPFLDPEAIGTGDDKRAPNGFSTKGWTFSVKVGL